MRLTLRFLETTTHEHAMKLKEIGALPISPENPAGVDAHYEPEFEQLQEEIDKLSIVTAGQPGIDWKRVTQLAFTILSEKSKDLLVASYLAIGLVKTHQFEGLSVGATVLKDLVDNFWDPMFPPKKRMRGRLNAISWWQEQLAAFLSSFEPDPLPADSVDNVRKTLKALDESLSEKTEGNAPSLRELQNYIERLPIQGAAAAEQAAASPPPEKPEPPFTPPLQTAQTPSVAPSAPPPPQAPTIPVDAGSAEEAAKLLKTGLEQFRDIADFTRKVDPGNPASYRLLRLAAWMPVNALPPVQDGNTLISAPDLMVKTNIESLFSGRNYLAASHACEENLPQYRFWLDLNRLAAQALEKMGVAYNDARDAICAETVLLVQRLTGLENLTFSDGTPFADAQTKSWLKTLGFGAGGGQDTAACSGAEAAVAGALSKAQTQQREQKLSEAVKPLQDGLSSAGSGKDKLLWRTALARFFLFSGKPELAEPFIEQLLADLDNYRIEEWDPALALHALTTAHDVLDARQTPEGKTKSKDALTRIMRISPTDALRISGVK
jgi:type VI secretion system protein VasJ